MCPEIQVNPYSPNRFFLKKYNWKIHIPDFKIQYKAKLLDFTALKHKQTYLSVKPD